mgnify:CR=1 FL=1
MNEAYDFKRFCDVGDGMKIKVLASLNNISANHVILIKRDVMGHNTTLLFVKQYSSSKQWEPQEACKFLPHIPNNEIRGVEQMPYDDHKKMVSGVSIEEQKIYWRNALRKK